MNIEIEHKLLIELPDTDKIKSFNGCVAYEISQTYLEAESGTTERVRRRVSEGNGTEYFHTTKRRISAVSRFEDETYITEGEYLKLLERRKNGTVTLEKTRYAFPFAGHTIEIDVFPFMKSTALLEVELSSEDEKFELPDFITVIRDVTCEKEYTNAALARIDRKIPEID